MTGLLVNSLAVLPGIQVVFLTKKAGNDYLLCETCYVKL